MTIKEQIDADLKTAMLGGDKETTSVLRGLKSTILYAEVAASKRDTGLTDQEVTPLLVKEVKKRQEAADLYSNNAAPERAAAELKEKTVIEKYLPTQLSEADIKQVIEEIVAETGASGPQAMGQVIGAVKVKTGGAADGATIARLVKEILV